MNKRCENKISEPGLKPGLKPGSNPRKISLYTWDPRNRRGGPREWTDYVTGYKRGRVVGGTVFSSYPNKTPGLGWV